MNTPADRRILAQSRLVAASRAGFPTAGNGGYTVYLVVVVVGIVVVPIVRSVVLGLAGPEVLATISSRESYRSVGAIAAIPTGGALLLGRTRGAVLPRPFLTEFLVGSGLARSDTLRRPFSISVTVLVLAAVTASESLSGRASWAGRRMPYRVRFSCSAPLHTRAC